MTAEWINLADCVDPRDAAGRSYREINSAKSHSLPIGSLVELDTNVRLFVAAHCRDCDQTPLYSLTDAMEDGAHHLHGYSEDGLILIRLPDHLRGGKP